MATRDNLKNSLKLLDDLVKKGIIENETDEYWRDIGAKILILIDQAVKNSTIANSLTPKVYTEECLCPLKLIFPILNQMVAANEAFESDLWSKQTNRDQEDQNLIYQQAGTSHSFYQLAYSRFCSFLCQLLGDRIPYVQKLLIKHIFDESYICSFFASDIYMFMMRIVHPSKRTGLAQLVMNVCRLAPPEAFVKGAALINRIKHPIVNFEQANYQYLLELS